MLNVFFILYFPFDRSLYCILELVEKISKYVKCFKCLALFVKIFIL